MKKSKKFNAGDIVFIACKDTYSLWTVEEGIVVSVYTTMSRVKTFEEKVVANELIFTDYDEAVEWIKEEYSKECTKKNEPYKVGNTLFAVTEAADYLLQIEEAEVLTEQANTCKVKTDTSIKLVAKKLLFNSFHEAITYINNKEK